MKEPKRENSYYFVDEAGDPVFYNRRGEFIVGNEGCSKILMLGFIETDEPKIIRQELEKVRDKIKNDPYLKNIPSLKKSLIHFHATDDCPEVRQEVYKCISKLNFKSQFVVARKIEGVFKKYHCDENKFYDALISQLFKNILHRAEHNFVYFSKRGSSSRQEPLERAIEHAKKSFERKFFIKIGSKTFVQSQVPTGEPCLQVIDYISWAIYRVFIKKEMRYFDFIKDKVSLIWDIYDTVKYPKNFYNKTNELDAKKISLP
ncbi:MAG: DUF3800 domain-containing protein [Candidatus Omnitrophica bacterium]|nr:DUF3800 domain-containing protein [Candidatus Omnitrophota bacterium]